MSEIGSDRALRVTSLQCPNCGGIVQLRGFAHTLSAACESCGAVIDTSTPAFRVVQVSQSRQAVPAIPLGSRGRLDNIEWQVIGFQVRSTTSDGETFEWREYVLFNPYRGFRYLTESDGHWNLVKTIYGIPEVSVRAVRLNDRFFRLFESGVATTVQVAGEFPWRLELNESVTYYDYIAQTFVLSAERTSADAEVTWSLGRYVEAEELWNAFRVQGKPPEAESIAANQPAPKQGSGLWKLFWASLLILLCVIIACSFFLPASTAFQETYEFAPLAGNEPAFVTPPFKLGGLTSNVEVSVSTDLDNNWAYFNFALINTKDGHAYNFGREVSYYRGSDSDGAWTEGSTHDSATVPAVPAGEYYLRVEPEMDKTASVMHYAIRVQRGVLSWTYFWIAALLLAVPPILRKWRQATFERARWQQSNRPLLQLHHSA